MRLTLQTDYALRTLMYVATREQRVTIDEVSRVFDISSAHVAKVVNQLSRLGMIRSIRGAGGGIELARAASDIAIGDVIRSFEGSLRLLDCVDTQGSCVIESFCKLKQVLAQAEKIQQEFLDDIALSDVIPAQRQLSRLSKPQ